MGFIEKIRTKVNWMNLSQLFWTKEEMVLMDHVYLIFDHCCRLKKMFVCYWHLCGSLMFLRDLLIEYNWLLLQLKRPIYNRHNRLRIFKFNLFIWYVLASASNGMFTYCLYESSVIWNTSKSCAFNDRQSSSYLSTKQLHSMGSTATDSMPSHFYISTPSWAMEQLLGFSIFSQQHSLVVHFLGGYNK